MSDSPYSLSKTTPALYAMVVAADGFICGIGNTPELAKVDALQVFGSLDEEVIYNFRPCSAELLHLFRTRGGNVSYGDAGGVLSPTGLDHFS